MENLNFIISGSNGWLSTNFISKLKNSNINLIKIENISDWDMINLEKFKIGKNILIHNGFSLPNKNKFKHSIDYQKQLQLDFKEFKKFFINNKIDFVFYPSSGRVYKENLGKSEILDIYSKQKIIEESFIQELSFEKNISYIIARIFTLIGPITEPLHLNSFNSIIQQTIDKKTVKILGNPNNLHSISIMDNLTNLVIAILNSNIQQFRYIFDVVEDNLTTIEFVQMLYKKSNLNINNIQVSTTKEIQTKYTGDGNYYKRLCQEYLNSTYDTESYIDFLLSK